MTRIFPVTAEPIAGQLRNVHRVTCSECTTQATMTIASYAGAYAPDLVRRHFRNKGWEIGKKESHDLCPACVHAARERRRGKFKVVEKELPMSFKATTPILVKTTDAPKVEPPREMTREDRRLIFAKLDEHYLDEIRGYDTGWTDDRVAKDLGVPRAWVGKVRDENFGPEEGSGEILRIQQAIAELKAQAVALLEQIDALKADLAALKAGIRK